MADLRARSHWRPADECRAITALDDHGRGKGLVVVRGDASAAAARRQKPVGPGRLRIRIGQTADGVDYPREARPAQASQPAVLEPADDRLVDPGQPFELPLRKTEPLTPPPNQTPDHREPAQGLRFRRANIEGIPGHPVTITGTPHPAIARGRARGTYPSAMHVGCIAARVGGWAPWQRTEPRQRPEPRRRPEPRQRPELRRRATPRLEGDARLMHQGTAAHGSPRQRTASHGSRVCRCPPG